MIFYTLGGLLLIAALNSWTSRINQFFFFGRTVPEHLRQSPAAASIARNYLIGVWIGLLPAAAVFLAVRSWRPVAALLLAVLVEAMVCHIAFARAHGQAGMRLKPDQAEDTVSRPREVELLAHSTIPSLPAVLAPFFAGLVVYALAVLWVSQTAGLAAAPRILNERVSAHGGDSLFGFSLGLLAASIVLMLLMRSSTRVRTSMASHTQRSSLIASWVGVVVLAAVFWFALFGAAIPHTAVRAFLIAVFIATGALLFWRTLKNKHFTPHPFEMQGDEHWRWGLYYHNSADPALFVQSRSCTGYSLNFARFLAWPLMALFLAWFVLVLAIAPHS